MSKKPIHIHNSLFDWGSRTYVMGIVNATPDSFSGDGLIQDDDWVARALAQAKRFIDEGADILDIGGESTRPGATPVSAEEEIERVIPIIKAISQTLNCPISIDTVKSEVAREAVKAGAHIINDVSALQDPNLVRVAAEFDVPIILTHNRHNLNTSKDQRLGGRMVSKSDTIETDLLDNLIHETLDLIDLAKEAGVPNDHIILDPGIGFGKTVEQNLQVIQELYKVADLGFPVLLGTSNKSVIGYTLDLPPDERVEGTAATVSIGIDRGADIIRVHQVKEMVRVARMTDALVR